MFHFFGFRQWFWVGIHEYGGFNVLLVLVLSQIGFGVSLVERGKVCAHWWPNLTLFLNHFYASVTEEVSLLEHADLWGLGSSSSVGLSYKMKDQSAEFKLFKWISHEIRKWNPWNPPDQSNGINKTTPPAPPKKNKQTKKNEQGCMHPDPRGFVTTLKLTGRSCWTTCRLVIMVTTCSSSSRLVVMVTGGSDVTSSRTYVHWKQRRSEAGRVTTSTVLLLSNTKRKLKGCSKSHQLPTWQPWRQ